MKPAPMNQTIPDLDVSPSIVRLAEQDASKDELIDRFDGARSAFIRRRILAETHWPTYRDAYEAAMERHCKTRRNLDRLRERGLL